MKYIPPPKELPPGSVVDTYLRDSGGEGQDRSVQSQLEEVEAYCKEHSLVLRHVYKDVAKSGRRIAGRAEFVRLVENCQARRNNPKGLLIWDYARFGRNAKDAQWGTVNVEHEGVIIHSLVDDIPEGPYKEVFRSLKHSGNESQSDLNSEAVKRMQHQLVRNNKAMFGRTPHGMKKIPLPPVRNERTGEFRTLHKWVPDPEIAPLVLRAFEMKDQGCTLREISAATGLYKTMNGFKDFFDNKIYKGVLEFGGETFEDYCDPIVPPELWDRLEEKRNLRRPGNGVHDPRRVQSRYILSGVLCCQDCGSPYVGQTIKQWEYYVCSRRKRKKDCIAIGLPKEAIEKVVLDAINEKMLTLENLLTMQNKIMDARQRNEGDHKRKRIQLDRDLSTAKKSITNLTKAIAHHGHSESLLTALTTAENEKISIQKEIQILDSSKNISPVGIPKLKEIAAGITETITNGPDQEKRNAIRAFTTRIIAKRELKALVAVIHYVPIKIINPAARGLLGKAGVPPRDSGSEELIEIIIPFKKVRAH